MLRPVTPEEAYLYLCDISTMELTFVTEPGETFAVEVAESMELENVMALLEAKVGSIHRYTLGTFDTGLPPSVSLLLHLVS